MASGEKGHEGHTYELDHHELPYTGTSGRPFEGSALRSQEVFLYRMVANE